VESDGATRRGKSDGGGGKHIANLSEFFWLR
jgi:hypothetical protein